MTKKATPPNFNDGWEYVPGAIKFEINKEGQIRRFDTKKIISSAPDSKGNILLYGNENRMEEFNPKQIAEELFGGREGIKIHKGNTEPETLLEEIKAKASTLKLSKQKKVEKFSTTQEKKECSRCLQEKELKFFNKDKKSSTGYSSQCTECKKIRKENYTPEQWAEIKTKYEQEKQTRLKAL